MFKKKQTLVISEPNPTYKVRYLGNVLTAMVKGDGCVDRQTSVLWNNFLSSSTKNVPAGLEMEMTVCNSGLKVITKEQGLTEYRAHRITYTVCPQQHPKLFVWVYKHEGRKLKSEVRCHAVLCKTDAISQQLAGQLQDRLSVALNEFMREKRRSQNSRRSVKSQGHVTSPSTDVTGGGNVRTKFLKVGQNFRPPIDRSTSAPKLGSITEGDEEDEVAEDDVDVDDDELAAGCAAMQVSSHDDDDAFCNRGETRSNGHVMGSDETKPKPEVRFSNGGVTSSAAEDEIQMLPAAGGVDSDSDDDGPPS